MASGKQILLSLLQEYSQKKMNGEELAEATDRIKAGLLLHGSSAHYMWGLVERFGWLNKNELIDDEERGEIEGNVECQGIGLAKSKILLSDLFSVMLNNETILETVQEAYPEIDKEEYEAAIHIMNLLFAAVEWHPFFESVENNGKLDTEEKEYLINAYRRKLKEYREDPEDYS